MNSVIKRNGDIVDFDQTKIINAITRAFKQVDGEVSPYAVAKASEIALYVMSLEDEKLDVESIQDIVIYKLMNSKRKDVAKAYIEYRYKRQLIREANHNTTDETILSITDGSNTYWNTENSNKNPVLNTTIRDYMAGAISTDISLRMLLPSDVVEADKEGILHFHDKDYFLQHMHNCCLINIDDMLQNGTVISDAKIDKPHSFSTACTITTQIISQVASSQYGGQSVTLTHLAPFVDVSRKAFYKEIVFELERAYGEMLERENKKYWWKKIFKKRNQAFDLSYECKESYDPNFQYMVARKNVETWFGKEVIEQLVNQRLKKEIAKGIQTIQYQIITLMTTNGQAPFLTIFMYLNEARNEKEREDLALLIDEMLDQTLQGVKNKQNEWVTPAFPKLIYVTEEDNITPDSKYWYLTVKAAKCSNLRLGPDYISEKKMKEYKEGFCYPVMGCRSALTVYRDSEGNGKFYGRFNQGVVTLNLPDIAFSSGGDFDKFWNLFEERTELCHKALRCRHERLVGTKSDVAPILWQNGALARLKEGEVIDKLLYDGYSTISLGYCGLYETTKYMTGHSHSEPEGEEFALKVMQALNDKCAQWKAAENIAYSLYGTPLETATYKFSNALKRRFGDDIFIKLDGEDRNYVTNSYHIPVFEEIDGFSKLEKEAKFQRLSPGGSISYVEIPNLNNNIELMLQIIQYMYETNMYAELNGKSDYCQKCGYNKEILLIKDENNKYIWKCPNCGNTDTNTMDITRRTCGYKGTARNGWNQGRLGDIHDRVLHFDDIEKENVNI